MEIDLAKLKIPIPRGMLFLYDQAASNVEIPVYNSDEVVSSTKTALSIAVQSDLESEISITVTNQKPTTDNHWTRVFSGQIFLETGQLNICIIGDESISQISAEIGIVGIQVFSNQEIFPDSVLIVIETGMGTGRTAFASV